MLNDAITARVITRGDHTTSTDGDGDVVEKLVSAIERVVRIASPSVEDQVPSERRLSDLEGSPIFRFGAGPNPGRWIA